MNDYPPEYDMEMQCPVCLRGAESGCDCPECPVCGEAGNPACYESGHMKPTADSVQALCDHVGIEPIDQCLRAIDKHNSEHVWLVFHGPLPTLPRDKTRVYYHDDEALKIVRPWMRLAAVGCGGIAWDDSSWEWGDEAPVDQLDDLRRAFHEALDDYLCSKVPDKVVEWLHAHDHTVMDYVNEDLPPETMTMLAAMEESDG